VIGTFPKDKAYELIGFLRNNQKTINIPQLLTTNILVRDVQCMGLESSEYGRGLGRLLEEPEENIRA